jgi:hypothetical protein
MKTQKILFHEFPTPLENVNDKKYSVYRPYGNPISLLIRRTSASPAEQQLKKARRGALFEA